MTRLVGILSICLFLIVNVYCADEAKVHFMDYSESEWQSVQAQVKATVTTQLNSYCGTADCKLTGSTNNISATVTFTGDKGTYKIDGRFAVVRISAIINSAAVTGEVLEQFMIARRGEIVSATGVPIAYVNDKLVYPRRDNTDNYVIISISSTIVLGLFILNLVMTKKSNEEEARLSEPSPEKKPLIKAPDSSNQDTKLEMVPETSESAPLTTASKTKPMNTSQKSISRDEAFDLKIDPKLNPGKHRKRNKSGSSHGSIIAGNVGSGIGSSRNLTEDEKWYNSNRMSKSQSNDLLDDRRRSGQHAMPRSSTEHPFRHVNIPTIDRSLDKEAADSKVAARLASNDQLA